MALWREKLFIAMYRNAGEAADYFKLPPERVFEVGVQLGL
jgi:KUP system potassium uptake protein